MTEDTLSKANLLKSVINTTERYLRDIKHYEHNLFSYNLQIVIPQSVGTFGTANKLYFDDKQLKKDILNTIKIHLVKKIQDAEKELESL